MEENKVLLHHKSAECEEQDSELHRDAGSTVVECDRCKRSYSWRYGPTLRIVDSGRKFCCEKKREEHGNI